VFKELSGRLDSELRKLDTLVAGELPAFNTALTNQRLEAIKDGIPAGTR
jgi:hypothetical protein